jgi:CPA1 family monovalent cation:H+ antiporter
VHAVELVLGLVTLAAVVATVADRLRAPAPSLLVLAGLLVGLLPGVPAVQVSPDVVSLVVLPPLLYAAATDLALPELRAVLRPVLVLSVGLVALTAFAVAGVVLALLPEVPFAAALVLGAVLASTDPVAVSALARRLGLPPRLLALVQGESLFNDATSLVLFRVAVAVSVTAAGSVRPLGVAGQFVWLAGGGVLIGLVVGVVVGWLRRRTEDAVLETLIALVTPYAAYVLAELARCSGVTAVVICGLWLGSRSVRLSSGPVRLQVATVYGVVVFVLESVVFAVIGLQFPGLVDELPDLSWVPVALAVAGTLLATRILFVAPSAAARREWRGVAVVWWAGARGVVPLAAALSIPLTISGGGAFPQRDLLLVLATSCIILTLVVQGLTLEPLARWLGVRDDPARAVREEAVARHSAAVAARARLQELLDVEAAPPAVADRLVSALDARVSRTQLRLDPPPPPDGSPTGATAAARPSTGRLYRELRRELLAAETAELARLRDTGVISEDVRRRVQRAVDLEDAALADGLT